MVAIVSIGIGDAREEILKCLIGQEIAVGQRFLAELGQIIVARIISRDVKTAIIDFLRVNILGRFRRFRHRARKRFASLFRDQLFAALIFHFHRHSFCLLPSGFFGGLILGGLIYARLFNFQFEPHCSLISTTKFSHCPRVSPLRTMRTAKRIVCSCYVLAEETSSH